MLKSYPPSEGIDQSGYIGALAAALMEYPPCIARKCADPIKGVARTTRFKPTVSDIIGWCEREIADLRDIVARQDRDRQILEARKKAEDGEAALAEARKARPNLEELRAKHGRNWGLKRMPGPDVPNATMSEPQARALARENERDMLADYRRRGIEPRYSGGLLVSPSLMVALGQIPERPRPATPAQEAAE